MGTPNRTTAQLVLGNFAISAEELEESDRKEILQGLLASFSSQLKYLSGFKELSEYLRSSRVGDEEQRTNPALIVLPPNLRLDPRLYMLAPLSHKAYGQNSAGKEYGCEFVECADLCLVESGELLVWNQKYKREVATGLIHELEHRPIRSVATLSTFVMASDGFELTPAAFKQAISSLKDLISNTVDERRNRLISSEALLFHTSKLYNRIV